MAADCIGIENLKSLLAQYSNISAIQIYPGSRKTSIPMSICSMTNGDVLTQFDNFISLQPDENKEKVYTLVVKFQGKAREIDGLCFTFAVTEKEKQMVVNGPAPVQTPSMANMDKYMELYMEVGYLRAENKRLNAENSQLLAEIAELTAELDESEINGTKDDTISQIKEFLPVIAGFFNKQSPNVVNGVEDLELNGIITELQTIDPNFKDNMFRLLKLAKNNPMMYKMAVGYLNNL